MGPRHLFTVSGIPVSIDPFFVLGAFFLYSWSGGGTAGLYSVIAIAVFVLIHELGHAFTAKAFGAESAVMLTFMGGFANYTSRHKLSVAQQVAISAAGPLAQLLAAIPVLWFAQHSFQTATTRDQATFGLDLYVAIAWAGILLAFLNLLPLWPLDGGHIADHLLGRWFGLRAARPFIYWSMGASALVLLLYFGYRGQGSSDGTGFVAQASFNFTLGLQRSTPEAVWLIFKSTPGLLVGTGFFIPAFCLFGSYARLQQLNRQNSWIAGGEAPTARQRSHEDALHQAQLAERAGWAASELASYPRGFEASPWLKAHIALQLGRTEEAVVALRSLADGPARRWVLDNMERPELNSLLAWVPPVSRECLAVLEARVYHGSPEDLVATAKACFAAEHSAEPLYLGAEGLAMRGLGDEAMQWLAGAVQTAPDPLRMGTARGFRSLHSRSDFQRLLGEAERAHATR